MNKIFVIGPITIFCNTDLYQQAIIWTEDLDDGYPLRYITPWPALKQIEIPEKMIKKVVKFLGELNKNEGI